MTDTSSIRKLTPRQQLIKEATDYLINFYPNLCWVNKSWKENPKMESGYYRIDPSDGYYKKIGKWPIDRELERQFEFRLTKGAIKEIYEHLDRRIYFVEGRYFKPVLSPEATKHPHVTDLTIEPIGFIPYRTKQNK